MTRNKIESAIYDVKLHITEKERVLLITQTELKSLRTHLDVIVLRVLARFSERSQVGITKYNTTLERTDLSTLEWLTHAQEEAMDFCLYLEKLKDQIVKELEFLVKKAQGKLSTDFIEQLDRNFNLKK